MMTTLRNICLSLTVLMFAGLALGSALPAAAQTGTGGDNVVFKKVWVDFDVYENNQKGMRVHIEFNINNFVNVDGDMVVRVLRDNKPVMANEQAYRSQGGDLAVYSAFKPAYDNTYYSDLSVFLPYEAIPLNPGQYQLQLDVDLIYTDGNLISHLTLYDFDFSR